MNTIRLVEDAGLAAAAGYLTTRAMEPVSMRLYKLEAPAEVTCDLISTPEQAERAGFRGSPTILVNGRDPFAGPGAG